MISSNFDPLFDPADDGTDPDGIGRLFADLRDIVGSTYDENPALVQTTPLAYREGMKTDTRPDPNWATPIAVYVQHLRAKRRSDGTIYLRSYHLRRVSQAFRGRSPYTLVAADIEAYLVTLRTVDRNYQRSILATLRGFYRHGVQHRLCQTNPCEYIDPIKPKTGMPRPAPVAAIEAAIAAATPRVRLMMYLAATAGLRRVEIARTRAADVFEKGGRYWLRIEQGKGDKKRDIPLLPRVSHEILAMKNEDEWLFPNGRGGHLTPGHVGVLMHRALPAGITPHMLRHRYASTVFASKRDLRAVQQLLGHESIATTQVYTEVPDDALLDSVAAVDRMMFPGLAS